MHVCIHTHTYIYIYMMYIYIYTWFNVLHRIVALHDRYICDEEEVCRISCILTIFHLFCSGSPMAHAEPTASDSEILTERALAAGNVVIPPANMCLTKTACGGFWPHLPTISSYGSFKNLAFPVIQENHGKLILESRCENMRCKRAQGEHKLYIMTSYHFGR